MVRTMLVARAPFTEIPVLQKFLEPLARSLIAPREVEVSDLRAKHDACLEEAKKKRVVSFTEFHALPMVLGGDYVMRHYCRLCRTFRPPSGAGPQARRTQRAQ